MLDPNRRSGKRGKTRSSRLLVSELYTFVRVKFGRYRPYKRNRIDVASGLGDNLPFRKRNRIELEFLL